ncbi:hypothetical protein SAMN05216604_107121 [Pseudomonas agarici]|nr:hypothetical protein SAMN05216604_107121 [Pseudomonas agarici]
MVMRLAVVLLFLYSTPVLSAAVCDTSDSLRGPSPELPGN